MKLAGILGASGLTKLTTTVFMIGAAVTTATLGGTSAIFTDNDSIGSNSFTTGSVDITASPASAVFNVPAMAPGDTQTAPIAVTNTGTLQLRYAVTSTSSEDILAAQLDMTVKSGVAVCDTASFDSSGTVLYGPGDSGSTTSINLIGDPAQGADSGDRVLSATASENLCIQIELPASTTEAFQGTSTTLVFDFESEQTSSN